MLPNDPDAPKSSDEPLRGRIEGIMGSVLFLLFMLPADEAVVVVVVVCAAADVAGVAGVGADAGAFCSCSRAAAGGALTSAEAAFEAMGVDIRTWTFD